MPDARRRVSDRIRRGAAAAVAGGVLAVVAAGGDGAGASARSARSGATELNGSAYGAYVNVGLFGGPPKQVGAAPIARLPADGGRKRASHGGVIAQFGPATVLGGHFVEGGRNPSGPLTVETRGRTGPRAFVESTASVVDIGPGPLIAGGLSSTCRADAGGLTGSVTVDEGVVETSYDPLTQEPATKQDLAREPVPNTEVLGTLDHVGDSFRIVFNEQVVTGETIVVRAAHMYLLGPIAVGDLIIGETVCGLAAGDGSAAPPTTVGSAGADGSGRASTSDGAGSSAPLVGGLAAAGVAMAGTLGMARRRRRPAALEDPS